MRVGDYHHSASYGLRRGDHNVVSPGVVLIRNVKKPNSDTIYKEVVRFPSSRTFDPHNSWDSQGVGSKVYDEIFQALG